MRTISLDYGDFQFAENNITTVTMTEGIQVTKQLAIEILKLLSKEVTVDSGIIINRKNKYSYTLEGMRMLTDPNTRKIIATAIVDHKDNSEKVSHLQIKLLEIYGRSNMQMFDSLELAEEWILKELESAK